MLIGEDEMCVFNKVCNTIDKYKMLSRNDRVLVCVSGGPDSVALLHLLYCLKDKDNLRLHIAHLNHMIRGSQAEDDAVFVRNLAKKLGLPIVLKREDVPSFAQKRKLSLEEGARILRYKFFLETAKKVKANKIAMAHSADDQAETVLMRIIRGTGLQGLGSIQPVSEQKGIVIIRPLIETWKQEAIDYLRQKKLRFRVDISNKDETYFRNKVRLNLIPYLSRNYNPRIKETLIRLGESVREDYNYLRTETEKAFLKLTENRNFPSEVNFSIKKLSKYPLAIQRGVIRLAIKKVKGDLRKISYQNWKDLNGLIKNLNGNKFLDLPENTRIRKEYDRLVFCRHQGLSLKEGFRCRLKIPGITTVSKNGVRIETKLVNKRIGSRPKDRTIELFDYDKLTRPLLVRNRLKGDRIKPLGMKGEKKLKDIFIDQKVPLLRRDFTPIIVSGDGEIVWVAGLKVSDRFKITPQTRQILKITLYF